MTNGKERVRQTGRAKKLAPYLLCAPLIALLLLLTAGLINALLQSLGYIPALGLSHVTLRYYGELLQNPDFAASLKLSLSTSLISSGLSAALGVAICAALCRVRRGRAALSRVVRIPVLVPHTVVALMTVLLFSQSGILSRIFYVLGLIASPAAFPNLLYNEHGAGIILSYVWKQAPFVAFFTLSLMAGISNTLEEAAKNLGASPLRAFFSVTLPLSMPAVAKAFLMILVFSFGAYELPFLLGPTKPKALPVQAYLEYTHPDLKHRPYAMAANGIMIGVSLLITLLYALSTYQKLKEMRKRHVP